jgi:hypothetical protein
MGAVEPAVTILAVVCAALAVVVLLGPASGVVRLRSILGGHSGAMSGLGAGRGAAAGRGGVGAVRAVAGVSGAGAVADPRRAGRSAAAVSTHGRVLAAAVSWP